MRHELLEKQVVYTGKKIRLEVHHLSDGTPGGRIKKEIVVHPGAVVLLPLLSDGRIVLIRNKRYTVGRTLVELPAGTLEPGEDPMNCAGRELLEETGYLAGRLKLLFRFYASPGILTEQMFVFAAYDLEPQRQALEADEDIEVMPVTLPEAIELIRAGDICDAKTIAAVLHYERFGDTAGVPR
jgi:ADP-ribose pyrophosphatase